MDFIKRVLSTVVGIFVFCLICFGLLLVVGLIFGSSSEEIVTVKPNSVLELRLDFPIRDYAGKTEYKDFSFLDAEGKDGLFNIIDAIEYAETDDNIKGITIENNFIDAGITQTKEIRDALMKFKKSGKFVKAYADVYSQKDYYLSSVANTVYLSPVGSVAFKGLYSEQLYLKDIQDKTGIKMEVIRYGKYKSAVEPYLSNEMSAENREQITAFLNSVWSQVKQEVSESRKISVSNLDTIADNLLARNATLAKSSNLVDKIAYYDEYVSDIKQDLGISSKDDIEYITIADYALYTAEKLKSKSSKNEIAVIYAEGEIVYGEGNQDYVTQLNMGASLKEARDNDKIKAVVLRINSPGGDAMASELIWREIELTKKVKPVIVSMGDLAASGGYYIACNADKIIAEPTTITGSIGVFGVLPNANVLAKNIGVNAEQVSTNKNAVDYSFFEPLSEVQHDFIKEDVINIYELFTNRVAVGRKMTQDDVKKIAEGRVWTGRDALKNGLVDEIGGLDLALKRAAEAANIKDYKIIELPIFEVDLTKVLSSFGLVKTKEDILKEELGEESYKILKEVKSMSQKKGVQLLFPYSIGIK
jgi:protease IV